MMYIYVNQYWNKGYYHKGTVYHFSGYNFPKEGRSCRELSLILFFSSTKGTNKFYHIDFLLNTFYCSGFLLEYIWKKFNCSNFLLKSNMWTSYIKYNQSIFSVWTGQLFRCTYGLDIYFAKVTVLLQIHMEIISSE